MKSGVIEKSSYKKIPFDFVMDYLFSLNPRVKPMFGSYALYVGEKIMLILRNRKDHAESNGIWIATKSEHHKSLKKEFSSMCSIAIFAEGKGETEWQMIPADKDDFESSAVKLCEFIMRGDERIGRIPKSRKSKKRKPIEN